MNPPHLLMKLSERAQSSKREIARQNTSTTRKQKYYYRAPGTVILPYLATTVFGFVFDRAASRPSSRDSLKPPRRRVA